MKETALKILLEKTFNHFFFMLTKKVENGESFKIFLTTLPFFSTYSGSQLSLVSS